MSGPAAAMLSGNRLHLQHGPIDLILGGIGPSDELDAAFHQARARFEGLLADLVAELPVLRQPAGPAVRGAVARRMRDACLPFAAVSFVTPMAAVAGAVADEILAAATAGRRLDKLYVNNGGDIAFHLAGDACFDIGMIAVPDAPTAAGLTRIDAASPVRGVATSGRRGRSLSRGIADSVSVLARTAAAADAAATLIANAVDCDHPAIRRRPACELDPDSDLGDRLVTVEVGELPDRALDSALAAGVAVADGYRAAGRIEAAVLSLAGRARVVPSTRP